MSARRGICGSRSTDIVIASGIVAETIGRGGDTAAIRVLGGISHEGCQRVNVLKYIAVGSGVFRLPNVCLGLSHRGIAAIRQTIGGVRGRIVTLTGV